VETIAERPININAIKACPVLVLQGDRAPLIGGAARYGSGKKDQ
jgi:hypothetical protein